MSETQDCLFCRIVAGEVPADVVAETEHSLAFRDISPQAPTHALVVPRRHVPDAASLAVASPDELADVVALAARVAEGDGLPGYRLVANTGAAAQQTVFHCHVHVLGGRELTWPPG
ncbi:histidine triad nucleotide-binding protein [Phycicoccus sonneratiae]|uniref:Histidine triad nucleotide-binding protein n=1 Tax=Phycicoccus sonneratiae TaxID=2807628 RepID=A0ABS2CGA8_9MICO|nr:histidine triad nucleotide-binding protein [Phycicoccus sonneraticus]MBM6398903.1 histidine triad nucleotide-binding protein [Phycicoccus sonneraticus]